MLYVASLALISLAGPSLAGADGERAVEPERRPAPPVVDEVTSITDLATPAELRGHGLGTFAAMTSGISITLVQAPGAPNVQGTPSQGFVPKDYALYEIDISAAVTGNGFPERLFFGTPWPPPTAPAPVLFFHHRFGKTHFDLTVSTTFLQAATSRGWYVYAPIGASNKSFGSSISQQNMEIGFNLLQNLPGVFFDLDRIYGVGFSMGGGSLMSYAARHTDATSHTMAALINHSGGTCLAHTYANDAPARSILEFWFGTPQVPGSGNPWEFARHSSIHFDPNDGPGGSFQSNWDMVRNVKDTPLWMLRASDDLIPYLSVQSDALDDHLVNNLGVVPGPSYVYDIVPYSGHDWSMLNEVDALDFLEQFTRTLPTTNDTLIDRDGRWYYFNVTRDAGLTNQFSELDWNVDVGSNSLTLDTTKLSVIIVETALSGLDPQSPLVVHNDPLDGQGDDIFLRDFPAKPSSVLRDGVPVIAPYLAGSLRLFANDDVPHIWTILP